MHLQPVSLVTVWALFSKVNIRLLEKNSAAGALQARCGCGGSAGSTNNSPFLGGIFTSVLPCPETGFTGTKLRQH